MTQYTVLVVYEDVLWPFTVWADSVEDARQVAGVHLAAIFGSKVVRKESWSS